MAKAKRYTIYLIGMVFLALSIILNSKANLGMGPVTAFSYSISYFSGLNFSNVCMGVYTLYFVIEEIVKFKAAKWIDLIQIPFCFVFTRIMSLLASVIPDSTNIWVSVVLLVLVILTGGLGVTLMVEMRIVPNPADGLVQAVSDRFKLKLGHAKNLFDLTCVIVALIFDIVFSRKIVSVGIATIVITIFTGRAVAFCKKNLGEKLKAIYENGI